MALRVMAYIALLWQDLLARRDATMRFDRRLPPVLPVVIHNGNGAWRAATDVADLLPALPQGLADYVPRFRYLLIDKNGFDDVQLRQMRNLLACVMRLERDLDARTHAEILGALRGLVSGAPELKRVFSDWLAALFADRPDVAASGALDLQETEMGLRENFERWEKQAIAKGRVEGRQEGEGLLLQRQLAKRFGPLPSAIVDRMASASREQIETWGDRVLDASSLEEVFAD